MRKQLLIIFISLYLGTKAQQNLIPNYSFENIIKCDNNPNQFNGYVVDWTGQNGVGGLGYFNAFCNTIGMVGVPQNELDYWYARTGNAYVGLDTYLPPYNTNPYNYDYRSYIQTKLISPLKAGVKYCVTFYVHLAKDAKYQCNDIGAYFSDSALYYSFTNRVKSTDTPQVANNPVNNPLGSKTTWTEVSGNLIAKGGEQYIVIGNFVDDAYTYIDSVGSAATFNDAWSAFYFIDDVSVRTVVYAHAGKDTSICDGEQVLLGKDTAQPGVSYHWEPTNGLSSPNSPQTWASPFTTTTYTLTIVNDSMQVQGCNCPDVVNSSTVTVEACPESLFIPTAFSPNNDGQNDILLIHGNDIKVFDIEIYDRWGIKVFESEDINQGWDGTYKGKPEDGGTYIYYAKGTYLDGTTFARKGNVTLVR